MTAKYPFEWKVFKWASHFSHRITGENRGFVLILCEGCARAIYFGEEAERLPPNADAMKQAHESWLIYDPFEGPVYTTIEWQNAPRSAVERLIGGPFDSGDFFCATPDAASLAAFPETWNVMF
jgi:hypothetical protein